MDLEFMRVNCKGNAPMLYKIKRIKEFCDRGHYDYRVQSLYNTPHYIMDLDITQLYCGSQNRLP